MSNLSAFLNPVESIDTLEEEVVISNRFRENGKAVPFRIRAVTQEENEQISRRCTTRKKENGQIVESFDNRRYSRELVLTATVCPDFSAKELCDKFKVVDPSLVPGKMLLSGEFAKLMEAITKLSGFDQDINEQAKN